jgi:Spy/CpxP family protein refolding chaperone
MKPRPGQILYQYIILATDEYMHSEVFILDADKADKAKIEELIKKKYAARYKIGEKFIEVKWLIELPRIT